ncbi:SDR family oxidoreductase [Lachnospiraceae bacterium WCA-9-b2]|uniref:SDR family oxidoreductase n=1 Tax=Sporofaciens musculi TaxID=2681861 RepID=A0A7X3MFW6_9FIRM|nr:SDR family oxidoreductase [Sporofaciens musculi]MXP75592.1 SDR family oxidoreductase [Sporofaciens musculi]
MKRMFDLKGKKAIVVGGAGDLGFGMLEGLVEAGAQCVVIDVDEKLKSVCEGLNSRGFRTHPVHGDISDRKQVRESYEEAMDIFGNDLDIMVNAAGIQIRHPSEEFPMEDWDKVLAVNLTGPWMYMQMAANTMIPKGYGKLVTVSSLQSIIGGVTIPAYTAAKGGLGTLIKTLSNDWAAKGLNINCIAPGYMATKLNTGLLADQKRSKEILGRIPQGRWGTGEDLKGVTVFLCSSASDYVNGITIPVDGGFLGR